MESSHDSFLGGVDIDEVYRDGLSDGSLEFLGFENGGV